ncbi:MAG: hypothetical protein J7493_04450 [Porphyrobacter sp.]|nr:hypothetical protein [Porphyrobacter sp.]
MKLGRTILASFLAASVVGMPVMAQAADGSSEAIARTGTEVADSDAFAGSTMLVAVVVIVGLLAGLLLIDSNDSPASP